MSVQIKTEEGWKEVAGNINPKLIADVNQRIDGYADRGYLTKSIIDTTRIKNVLNNNGAVRRGYDVKILTSGKYYISIENNTGNTIDAGYCAEYGTASNLDNFTVTNGSKREIFKDLEEGNGFTLWNVVNSNVKITVALSEVALPYVPSNVELQSEIDAIERDEYTGKGLGMSVSKWGKMVQLNIYVGSLNADCTPTTALLNIAEKYRPSSPIFFRDAYSNKLLRIHSNGNLLIEENATSGTVLRTVLTYLI